MKVSCDICEAQYNIDESKIPVTGLAVKCTKCKHLFIVRPPEPVQTAVDATEIGELIEDSSPKSKALESDAPAQSEERSEPEKEPAPSPKPEPEAKMYWTITKQDGQTFDIPDNATLQRWIVENKVLASDKLSTDGQTYQTIGDLEEYKPFFDIVKKKQEDIEKQLLEQEQRAKARELEQKQREAEEAEANRAKEPITKTQTFIAQQPEHDTTGQPEQPSPEKEEQAAEAASETTTGAPIETATEKEQEKEIGNLPQADSSDEKVMGENISSANRSEGWSNTGEFAEWNEIADDDSEFSRKGSFGKILLIIVILIAIAAGITYYLKPDLLNQFIGSGMNEAEQKVFENAQNSAKLFTLSSLNDAEKIAINLKERNDSMIEIIALLAHVYIDKAELFQYDVTSLENKQAEINNETREANLALQKSKRKTPELKQKLEEWIKAQNQINEQLTQATSKYNNAQKTAYSYVEEANKKHPQAFETYRALAAFYTLGKDSGKANEFLEKAIKINSEDARSMVIKGYLYALDKALYAEAHKTLQMAILKDPTLIKAKIKEALIFADEDNIESARNILSDILANYPDHSAAKVILARLPQKEKAEEPKEEVKKDKQEKQEDKPQAPQTYESLMRTAERLRKTDKTKLALSYYQKAARLKSTAEVLSGIGYCYLDLENMQGALDQFKKSLGKNKQHPDSLFGLATTYEILGNTANAIKYYKRYLKHNPNALDAKAAKRSLDRLKQ